jgi:hypothetical protein
MQDMIDHYQGAVQSGQISGPEAEAAKREISFMQNALKNPDQRGQLLAVKRSALARLGDAAGVARVDAMIADNLKASRDLAQEQRGYDAQMGLERYRQGAETTRADARNKVTMDLYGQKSGVKFDEGRMKNIESWAKQFSGETKDREGFTIPANPYKAASIVDLMSEFAPENPRQDTATMSLLSSEYDRFSGVLRDRAKKEGVSIPDWKIHEGAVYAVTQSQRQRRGGNTHPAPQMGQRGPSLAPSHGTDVVSPPQPVPQPSIEPEYRAPVSRDSRAAMADDELPQFARVTPEKVLIEYINKAMAALGRGAANTRAYRDNRELIRAAMSDPQIRSAVEHQARMGGVR